MPRSRLFHIWPASRLGLVMVAVTLLLCVLEAVLLLSGKTNVHPAAHALGLLTPVLVGFVAYVVVRQQYMLDTLERSEHELALQTAAMDRHAIVSITDGEGRITYANAKFIEVSGYSQEELMGQDHRLLNSGHHTQAFFEHMWQVLQRGEIWQGEICNRSKSGELYWVYSTIVPFMDDAGRPRQYISIRTDITVQKRMETAALEQERFLRQVLDNQSVATFLLDANHRVLFWNRACERLTGLQSADIVGKAEAWRGFYPAPRPCLADLVLDGQQLAAGSYYDSNGASTLLVEGWHAEAWFDSLGGQRRYVIFDAAPIVDAHGVTVAVIETLMDVTAAKRDEEALAQSRDSALETVRLKSEFLSTMSHEIRTPMNGVIGMSELLLDTPLDGKQVEFATAIRDSGQALLAIINDILDYSKIEAGRVEIEEIEFSLRQVVEGSVELLSNKAYEKGLSLISFVDPAIPDRLVGDPTRLRQILLNLLTNAVKFTSSGEIVVRALAETPPQDTHPIQLRLEVEDRGIGIAPEVQGRLFQPFSQADSSTTRQYGGTGLGLSISRQLAQLMGGDISLQSREGEGSTFRVRLPLRVAAQQAVASPAVAGAELLLVGGSSASRSAFLAYLSGWHAHGDSVDGLAQAQQMLASQPGGTRADDLVLLLQPLPDAGMLDALQALRAMPDAEDLPIIACLAAPDYRLRAELEAHGTAAILVMPVKQAALHDAIAAALHPAPATAGSAATARPEAAATPAAFEALENHRLILLAEDNPVNQQVAVHLLNKLGYAVHIVSNGQEAVAALESLPYALVLMDCQMPVMDGFEAAHAIRRNETGRGHRVPIVAMTANAMQGDRERCMAAGMDDYLAKPIETAKLQAVLHDWLPQATAAPVLAGNQAGAGASAATAAPMTLARLHEFVGDDEAAIAELLQVFADSLRRLRERLKTAVAARDPAIRDMAHELKGSAANMGAQTLAELARVLEQEAPEGNWRMMDVTYAKLAGEIDRVERYIADRKAG